MTMSTAFSLGRAISNAPDLAKAKVAASRIIHLLERESKINVNDLGGEKLVWLELYSMQLYNYFYHSVGHNYQS